MYIPTLISSVNSLQAIPHLQRNHFTVSLRRLRHNRTNPVQMSHFHHYQSPIHLLLRPLDSMMASLHFITHLEACLTRSHQPQLHLQPFRMRSFNSLYPYHRLNCQYPLQFPKPSILLVHHNSTNPRVPHWPTINMFQPLPPNLEGIPIIPPQIQILTLLSNHFSPRI